MKKLLLGCVGLSLSLGLAQSADAFTSRDSRHSQDYFRFTPKVENSSFFTASNKAKNEFGMLRAKTQLPSAERVGYLQAPDGSIWFYTQNNQYDNGSISRFSITIYDDSFAEVGKVEDAVTLGENETRVVDVQLGSLLSKKFFNFDDSYEVMVMIACNTVDYVNAYYTRVYAIGSNEAIAEVDGYYVSDVNTATDSFSENFWITFITEEDTETPKVGEVDNMADYVFRTYKKAGYGQTGMGEPVLTVRIPMITVAGSEAYPFISSKYDGSPWFAVNRLRYSWFEEPYNIENETPTADNALLIDTYTTSSSYSSTLDLYSQTVIPSGATLEDRYFLYHGAFSGDGDLSFDRYTTDGLPSLIITKANLVGMDNYDYDYMVYAIAPKTESTEGENAAEAKLLVTIATGTTGGYFMDDVAGADPQVAFVRSDENSNYSYEFVNLVNGEVQHTIGMELEGGYTMTTELVRLAANGGYVYATAQLTGEVTDAGDVTTSMVYVRPDGSIDHVDTVNLGKDVDYALFNIDPNAFNPYLFDLDAEREYMLLVKRKDSPNSASNHEELIVTSAGEEFAPILQLGPDNEIGALSGVSLVNTNGKNPRMDVVYITDDWVYTPVTYELPVNLFENGDGTLDNPYQITSAGGFGMLNRYPKAHFVIVNDIDASDYVFESDPMLEFYGSLDGQGYVVKNMTINGGAIFSNLYGDLDNMPEEGAAFDASANTLGVVQNINFINPTFNCTSGETGMLVGNAMYGTIRNIHIYGGKYNCEGSVAGLVGTANSYSTIETCSVNADITTSGDAAGIALRTMTSAVIRACAFTGSITSTGSNVGGIISSLNQNAGGVYDCHVDATIVGSDTVGGIVGTSSRAIVQNCHVEGSLEATTGDRWGGGPVLGGVIGRLEPDYAGSTAPVVIGNFVNLTSMTYSGTDSEEEYAGQSDTMHRIVGSSQVNDAPEIIDYDPENNWAPIYGDPMGPDAGLKDNYASATIAVVNSEIAADATTTEGSSLESDLINMSFFESIGWVYGMSAEEPWSMMSYYAPMLYFEGGLAVADSSELNLKIGEEAVVEISFFGVDNVEEMLYGFYYQSSDYEVVEVLEATLTENGTISVPFYGMAEGTANVTLYFGNVSTTVAVTVVEDSGVDNIVDDTISAAITVVGRTVYAEGNAIEVYNLSGMQVAAGADSVTLTDAPAGVYIVRAGATAQKVVIR